MTEKVIMYDSSEAASFKRGLVGWVSSNGRYWGNNEHMARWSGATHKECDSCGTVHEISSLCRPCREKKMAAKFEGYPVEQWDGVTPLCVFDTDTFFFDEDALLDYLAGLKEGDEPRICKCKPGYLGLISDDNWCDDLPEDGELPAEVEAAVEALNAAIKKTAPVCWWEDEVAIDVSGMLSRMRQQHAS